MRQFKNRISTKLMMLSILVSILGLWSCDPVYDLPVKPSRMVKMGETLKVRKSPITKSLKILALSEKRMGAKLVPDFLEDITPKENLEILEMQKSISTGACAAKTLAR